MRPWLLSLALAIPPVAVALEADKPFADYVVDSWDVKQGLPQISVLAMTQDADGYLWFGTQTGLARFDGMRFQRYNPRDALGVNSNIQALLADNQRRLWIGTGRGLLVMEDGHFRRVQPVDAAGAPMQTFPVAALAMDGGRVLVTGADGIYTPERGRLRRLHALPEPALSLLVRRDGLWVGGAGRVYRIGPGGVVAYPLPAATGSPVTTLAWHHGSLWAGTNRGLFHRQRDVWLDAGNGSTPTIEAMASDRDDNLWIATSQYLERRRQGRPVERIQGTPGSIAVRSIYEDHDGNLWLGSQTEGVARVWNGYTRRLDRPDGLATPLLWAISGAPDGGVWLGTADGVEVWRNGRIQQAVAGARLPHPEAYSLLAEAGQVWIGTRAGVALLRAGRLEQPALLAPLRNLQINGILRDRGGRLWFASSDGLFALEHDRLVRYGQSDGLVDARIRVIHETRDGRLLIGSTRGLYEWREGRILALGRQTGLDDDIAITALLELANGHWVAGSSNGDSLHVFDGRRWHAFGSDRGLPINIPFHLAEQAGSLWVAGMQGVYRLPLAQLARALRERTPLDPQLVINSGFDRPGGQQDKCCNGAGNSRGLLRDGQLWLPTRNGALLVRLAAAEAGTPRQVRIEGVTAQGHTYVPGKRTLRLPMDARDLRFDFTAPAFQPAQLPRLRYRLDGFDKHWRELENPSQRSASYVNLPPGKYRFEAADFSSAEPLAGSAHLAHLEVSLPPHLHETRAFRLLGALLAVSLLWLAYLGLRHRYARQRMVLEQLVQERTRDLQAANARLKEISFTDPLTGLHNRRYLTQQIPIDLSFYQRDAAYREGRDALVIALLDVDHFKVINDTWGHAAGDRVLEQIGQLLGELKRNGDYVARWGGEEFLLVLRPLPRGSLASIGERLCSRIAAHRFDLGNGAEHRLTVSIGLVECPLFPDHPQLLGWEQLVILADRAMYAVKNSGRNGWMAYRPLPQARLPEDPSAYRDNARQLLDSGLLELFGAVGGTPGQAPPSGPPTRPPPPSPDQG